MQKNLKPHPRGTKRNKTPSCILAFYLYHSHSCLTQKPALAPEPGWGYSCGTAEKMATEVGEFSFSTLFLLYNSLSVPAVERWGINLKPVSKRINTSGNQNRLKSSATSHLYRKIRIDFLLGISN